MRRGGVRPFRLAERPALTVDWVLALSSGLGHRDFMRLADLLLKVRNYSLADLKGMTAAEIGDCLEALIETEKAAKKAQDEAMRRRK